MENSLRQKKLESEASVETRQLHEGKFFSLKCDTLQIEGHPPHMWYVILHPGAAAVLPITESGDLVLIKQWRRAIGKIIYEIVAGTLEENESPLSCAERETQEEAGYRPETLIPLGGFYSAPGFCTEYIHLFLAENLSEKPLPKDLHEAIDVVEMSLDNALDLIETGEIVDAKTICAIFRYQQYLQKRS